LNANVLELKALNALQLCYCLKKGIKFYEELTRKLRFFVFAPFDIGENNYFYVVGSIWTLINYMLKPSKATATEMLFCILAFLCNRSAQRR
jgi:hypothetical protein